MPYTIATTRFDWEEGEPALSKPLWIAGRVLYGRPLDDWREGIEREDIPPVGYERGAVPYFHVRFEDAHSVAATVQIRASNLDDVDGLHVAPTNVAFTFSPLLGETEPDTCTDPVRVVLSGPLPSTIGVVHLRLRWWVLPAGADPIDGWQEAGDSEHVLVTTWKAPIALDLGSFGEWRLGKLLQWSSEFAAGQTTQAGICDALITNLSRMGLSYHFETSDATLEAFLREGGACRLWAVAFQALAAWQGIRLERRGIRLLWEDIGHDESVWAALVSTAPGINNSAIVEQPSEFVDANQSYPIQPSDRLTATTARRYRFWGDKKHPGQGDGHVFTLLPIDDDNVRLYDPAFSSHGVDVAMAMPPDDFSRWTGEELDVFRASYFDATFPYLLGSLRHGDKLYEVNPRENANGISVAVGKIPSSCITLIWSGI